MNNPFKKFLNFYKRKKNSINWARSLGVKIGNDCKIATYEWGSEPYLIEIGNHVHITNNVQFINHDGGVWVFRKEVPDFDVFGKIRIGDNVYIGNNAIVMPGVTIGENCVIGANSVVTKSIPENSVVAGVPAKFICNIKDYKMKMEKINTRLKLSDSLNKKRSLLALEENHFIIKNELNK
tara:strand:- start:916 stop:1455 length:540 start_codon:yes stop_codon:yes gene_type:complete